MKLSSEEVAQYLREYPQFFDEYAGMLAEIQVPYAHDGRAIPISERQIVALRDKNHILQSKLGELIRFGEEIAPSIKKCIVSPSCCLLSRV